MNLTDICLEFVLQCITMSYMLSITRLLWDDRNINHIAIHEVTPQEVEAACQGQIVVLQAKDGRLAVIGVTTRPRMLTVILNPQTNPGDYYVVTARDSSKDERQWYRTYTGGNRNEREDTDLQEL